MRPHTLAALICQGLYEQVRALASAAGRPGAETSLVTGYGAMAETAVVSDLWDVSRDRLALDTFLGRHGYHGPAEGELAAHPWRVDRAPLHALLKAYRDMPEDRDPRVVEAQRTRERLCTEADVLAAVSPVKRPSARLTLRLAARFFPLRGVGKGAFLQCADVVRFVARAHGDHLAAEGVLADPCVIGTRTGTAALRTGDRVRVDGGRGEVLVLQRRRA